MTRYLLVLLSFPSSPKKEKSTDITVLFLLASRCKIADSQGKLSHLCKVYFPARDERFRYIPAEWGLRGNCCGPIPYPVHGLGRAVRHEERRTYFRLSDAEVQNFISHLRPSRQDRSLLKQPYTTLHKRRIFSHALPTAQFILELGFATGVNRAL